MDPVSAAASILALVEGTANSTKYIYRFFKNVADMPLEVQNHCASIQALSDTLMELQAVCSTCHLGTRQITQLSQSVRECLADVQVAEKHIEKIEQDLTAKLVRRTWSKIKYGLIKEGPWLEKFFDRIKMWNAYLTYNLMLLQIKFYTEIKALVIQSNSMLQNIGPLLTHMNDHLLEDSADRHVRAQSERNSQPAQVYQIPPKLEKYLQTAMEPTYISGRYFCRINIYNLICFFRRGRIIVQKWDSRGEPSYETIKTGSSCVIELSAQMPWLVSRRFSIMVFLTSKMWARWRSVATFRISSQRIVSKNAEAAQAAKTGDVLKIKNLFSNKRASPGDILSNGYSLTHIAVSNNQFAVVELLLREGADLDAVTDYGDTALHLAVREHVDYEIARILLENGAEIESWNKQHQTPLHSFFNPLVSQLARRHASTIEGMPTDVRGMTLAHYFSWTNSSVPEDFQCLPNIKAFLDTRDANGRLPLHLAAHRGNIAVMKYLLSQTSSHGHELLDNKGNTSMHHAVLSVRAPDAIKLLLSHNFPLDARNCKGHTPTQHAACCGTVEALSFLIEHDPALLTSQDAHDQGLLELAEAFENKKVIAWLTSKFGTQGSGSNISLNRPRYQSQGSPQRRWNWIGFFSMNQLSTISVLLGLLLGYFLGSTYKG